MPHPFDQHRYQVRVEWGAAGLARLAGADIVVVVDVLRFSTTVTDAVARGDSVAMAELHAVSINGAAVTAAAVGREPAPLVLLGCLRNATAVARAVLAEQQRRGARTSIAVIACGEFGAGEPRFAVEDQLGAGAIIDALAALGLDHSSPEAAGAGEAFRGLRGGLRHLLAASGSGQELIERGLHDEVLCAAELDATSTVPVLCGGVFKAL
ncbi:MAG: 2-phosphosulfolactate phosphatase [Microbacterium sp.]|uniref:2-phosphosulfolactate phosphatase n=1 Tax=Microbacterium sp. TaxID=51671 RepID=UPI003A83919B